MAKTAIDWATDVWNPVTGCTPVSDGCTHCYARRMSKRLAGRYGYPKDEPFRVMRHPDKLEEPLKWKKPRRIFVCSMADIFHDLVEDWALDEIFGVMLACRILNNIPDHTFVILTKRPERMLQYFNSREPMEHIKAWANASNWITLYDEDMTFMDVVYSATCHDWDENGRNSSGSEYRPWGYINKLWPLPNVWLGVTAENQEQADQRIPILLQTPAAVRWVSVEPMLGPMDLRPWLKRYYHGGKPRMKIGSYLLPPSKTGKPTLLQYAKEIDPNGEQRADRVYLTTDYMAAKLFAMSYPNGNVYRAIPDLPLEDDPDCLKKGLSYQTPQARIVLMSEPVLDWVICGGESGPGARPMHPDWARSLRDQCTAAGVPYFFKQYGEWVEDEETPVCGICGCTEEEACPGGCYWVEDPKNMGDLCSNCIGKPAPTVRPIVYRRVGKKAAGRLLDGREWNEFPRLAP